MKTILISKRIDRTFYFFLCLHKEKSKQKRKAVKTAKALSFRRFLLNPNFVNQNDIKLISKTYQIDIKVISK